MRRFAAGIRRFAVLVAVIAVVTTVVSLVLGLAAGSSANRSISIGLYLVGSFMLIAGFVLGNRGPARLGARRVRWATLEERVGSLNDSALFVTAGFVLIVLGALVDSRESVF